MKHNLCLLTLAATLVCPTFAQDAQQTMDGYCNQVSTYQDKVESWFTLEDAIVPTLPAAERPGAAQDLTTLKALSKQIRKDACLSPDLKKAKASVSRDSARFAALAQALIARIQHDMAEQRRTQAAQ
jgi:hypothetical protein